MTPFMIVTPHCEALRWILHYTGEQIRNVWLWLGGYLVWYMGNKITPFINMFRTNVHSDGNNQTNFDNNAFHQSNIIDDNDDDDDDDDDVRNIDNEREINNNNLRRRTRSTVTN